MLSSISTLAHLPAGFLNRTGTYLAVDLLLLECHVQLQMVIDGILSSQFLNFASREALTDTFGLGALDPHIGEIFHLFPASHLQLILLTKNYQPRSTSPQQSHYFPFLLQLQSKD